MKRLFQTLNLNGFTASDIEENTLFDNEKSDVYLTFRWTSRRKILFYKFHLKVNGNSTNLIDSSVETSDGDHTFFVGSFENGVEIEVSYGGFALTSIPKIVALLTQTNPQVGFQASPKDPGTTHKIDSGNKFEETIKYRIQ